MPAEIPVVDWFESSLKFLNFPPPSVIAWPETTGTNPFYFFQLFLVILVLS
jgi:hypothetical protein